MIILSAYTQEHMWRTPGVEGALEHIKNNEGIYAISQIEPQPSQFMTKYIIPTYDIQITPWKAKLKFARKARNIHTCVINISVHG